MPGTEGANLPKQAKLSGKQTHSMNSLKLTR